MQRQYTECLKRLESAACILEIEKVCRESKSTILAVPNLKTAILTKVDTELNDFLEANLAS